MKFLFPLLVVLIETQTLAQSCSDAGFCTMGAMRPNQNLERRQIIKLRSIEYNFYRGKTTTTPVVYAHTIDFNILVGKKSAIQIKVPYLHIAGNLGSNHGIGDVSLSFTRNISKFKKWQLSGTVGMKIPTNQSNQTFNSEHTSAIDVPLPMYYQVSLGSIDLVAGASLLKSNWLIATGIQVALEKNQNQYSASDWTAYPFPIYLNDYDEGQELRRGIDIMLRLERKIRFINYYFSIGLLPIYRATKDQIYLPKENRRVKLNGTTGLALSGIVSFGYHINAKNQLKLIYGYKFVDRQVNPDGLTRDNVMSVGYIYKF